MIGKDKAVFHYSNYGPAFGEGCDLKICDKSNVNNGSVAEIHHTYKNSKYQYNDQNASLKFGGNPHSYTFKTK